VVTKTLPLSLNITEISVCQCYTNKKGYVPLLSHYQTPSPNTMI